MQTLTGDIYQTPNAVLTTICVLGHAIQRPYTVDTIIIIITPVL